MDRDLVCLSQQVFMVWLATMLAKAFKANRVRPKLHKPLYRTSLKLGCCASVNSCLPLIPISGLSDVCYIPVWWKNTHNKMQSLSKYTNQDIKSVLTWGINPNCCTPLYLVLTKPGTVLRKTLEIIIPRRFLCSVLSMHAYHSKCESAKAWMNRRKVHAYNLMQHWYSLPCLADRFHRAVFAPMLQC